MMKFMQTLTPFQLSLIIILGLLIFLVTISVLVTRKSRLVSVAAKHGVANGFMRTASPACLQGHYILDRNTLYGVGGQGQPPSGKYTVLSGQENATKIAVMLNGEKVSVNCSEKMELSDGDTICPVSHKMILR